MPIITEAIPQQNFEIVQDAIGAILLDELTNQQVLQPSLTEVFTVFKERVISIDKTEEVLVNVLLDSVDKNYENQADVQNRVSYFVDIYASGIAAPGVPGDNIVATKLLRYAGLCRYILDTHKYVTLGFAPGFIGGTSVRSLQMFEKQDGQDANYSRMLRIVFDVRMMESQELWQGLLMADHITEIRLDLTDLGYRFISLAT